MKKMKFKRMMSLFLVMILTVSQFMNVGIEVKADGQAEGTWTATEYIANGDFETGDAIGWNIAFDTWEGDTKYEIQTNEWASNNKTTFLNFYNTVDGNRLTISQTIETVPAGTYRLSFEQDGAEGTSGLSVSVADTSMILPATTGWDKWTKVITDSFTLTEDGELTITISGTVLNGYWGDFDNFVLEKFTAAEKEPEGQPDEELVLEVKDAAFEGRLWDDGIWTVTPETWNNTEFKYFTYAEDSYLVTGENQGTTAFKFWSQDAQEVTLLQNVDIPAGTYKVASDFMGEKGSVQVVFGNQQGTVAAMNGWNSWTETNDTFTVTENTKDTVIGFKLTLEAGAYGYIDSISVTEVADEELQLEVLDATFEGSLWDDGIWKVTPATWDNTEFKYFTYADDSYLITGENQGTTAFKFWSEGAQEVTLLQTVDIPAGTYKVTSDFMGEKGSVQVVFGNQQGTAVAMNGYNKWVETNDTFTVTENTKDTVIGFKLTLEAGAYGYIDSISVTEVTDEEEKEEETPEPDTPITGELNVEKIKNLPKDFIMGMDISSVMSEFASGVTYKDFEGNTIDNITDFCKFLAANGITHIRVRVWNNPFDANGNGYGGGNNDVATAAKIAEGCRAAGLKMLIDFHCSDLWADPGKQQVPKAWTGYTLEQKEAAVEEFIGASLRTIDPNHETVAMVQVGNETTGAFVGESGAENMCKLFNAGARAIRVYDEKVKVVIHVTNPEKGNVTTWAKNLSDNKVDYDVLATSYYPYWHGTLANLQSELSKVKKTYGKDTMVAETSYAYTLEDSDGHANTVRVGNNDSGANTLQPFTVQGQATAIRNVMETVNNAGGLGVFYWEPAWITVVDTTGLSGEALEAQITANKEKWEKFGSGWASSYGGEYDPNDAGKWYGGSAVDNEAMFYPDGTPTAGLYVWNYVKTGAVSKYVSVDSIENPEGMIDANAAFTLPETVVVTYNSGEVKEAVTWNADEVAAVNTAVAGTYKISGTVIFSKTVDQGAYSGMTSAKVIYTLTVKQPNLITDANDAGFEKGENYETTGEGISDIPAKDDPYKGKGSMHWWNTVAATGTVTYKNMITLEPGKYSAQIMSQGFAGDKINLQILGADEKLLFEGDAATLEGWAIWKTASISFEVKEQTAVKIRIVVNMQDGGWGTADELYLYRTGDVEAEIVEEEKDATKVVEVVDADGNKSYTMTNENAEGITISGANEVLGTAKFEAELVKEEDASYKKIVEQVKKIGTIELKEDTNLAIVKVNLWNKDGTQIHEDFGTVSVTIALPKALKDAKAVEVFRVEKEKLISCANARIVDGKIVFETDHFSTFLIKEKTIQNDENNSNENNSNENNSNENNTSNGNTDNGYTQEPDDSQDETATVTENKKPAAKPTLVAANSTKEEQPEKVEEAKTEETKTEEIKTEETKTEETKTEEPKAEETKEETAEAAEPNTGGSIPVWAVVLAVIVFCSFAGIYVFAKQKKHIK